MKNIRIYVISLDHTSKVVATSKFEDIPLTRILEETGSEIHYLEGPLENVLKYSSYDAIITPGNSYGHMTGGFDGALVDYFGEWLDQKVRQHIEESCGGELLVGSALHLRFNEPSDVAKKLRHLIYTPTMRVPMQLDPLSEAPYNATRAAFQLIARYNKDHPTSAIKSILLPVFGINTGRMRVQSVAFQMQLAIANTLRPVRIENLFADGVGQHNLIKMASRSGGYFNRQVIG